MEYKVNRTRDGIKSYPIHSHETWEVMCYTDGCGIMNTESGSIPFSCGTIIAIPPGMKHGSESNSQFHNISIESDFALYFDGTAPIATNDTEFGDAITLAKMVWNNRYGDKIFENSLIQNLAYLIKSKTASNDPSQRAINNIKSQIQNHFADSDFRPEALLSASGYAPDYIRDKFKKVVGYTPVEFLNVIRISEAVRIFEIYGRSVSVTHVATLCGFSDPTYFSRCFRKIKGFSPEKFKKALSSAPNCD